MSRYIFLLTLLMTAAAASAQAVDPAVRALLEKVHAAYQSPDRLSFSVTYTYANEGAAVAPEDSMSGVVEMDKASALFTIQGIKTLRNEQYSLQVLPDDKLIYISKGRAASPIDPAAVIDSAFAHMGKVAVSLEKDGDLSVIHLRFPPGYAYTEARMTVDPATGLLRRLLYRVNTAGWLDKDQINAPGHPAPYKTQGEVNVVFSGYAHGRFANDVFDPNHFFTRTGKDFTPAAAYKDYHIFLASPNL